MTEPGTEPGEAFCCEGMGEARDLDAIVQWADPYHRGVYISSPDDDFLTLSYCPFCGENLEESE